MTKKTAENTAPHKKRGPKPVEIKMDQLVVLAGMQCTYEEIAAVFGIKKRQFIDRVNADPELKEAIEEGWAKGRMSIRREQFKLLQDGNPTMAVWLGKQYCRQRDQIGIGNPDGSANSMPKIWKPACCSRFSTKS